MLLSPRSGGVRLLLFDIDLSCSKAALPPLWSLSDILMLIIVSVAKPNVNKVRPFIRLSKQCRAALFFHRLPPLAVKPAAEQHGSAR